jgi:hypothetical protein
VIVGFAPTKTEPGLRARLFSFRSAVIARSRAAATKQSKA